MIGAGFISQTDYDPQGGATILAEDSIHAAKHLLIG